MDRKSKNLLTFTCILFFIQIVLSETIANQNQDFEKYTRITTNYAPSE